MNEMTAPLSPTEGYTTADGRKIGGVVMEMKNITLRFGGVEAIKDISFDIREGEIRAIIGPNGAGKSSMLNVISGFYHPQEGEVWYRGSRRPPMKPYQIAQQGIARTFQNIALFEGMTVLDNVMTGRLNHMNASFLDQAFWWGKAQREEVANRQKAEEVIDFLEIQNIRKTPVGRLPYGLKKRVELARALAARAQDPPARRTHGGDERRGEGGHEPLHPRRERRIRDDHRPDRARHGGGHGPLRPGRGDGLRQEDRGRDAGRGALQPGGHRRLSGGRP
jgi:ABC-type uncharacterized transport system ATPase subunit